MKSLDTAGPITVSALKKGDVEVADLFSTDPSIAENDFVVLDDPKNLFGAQNVVPLVYKAGVDSKATDALNAVSAKLDTTTLGKLVKEVVSDKKDADVVAKERVRLEKDVVTDEVDVDETVRKEHIEEDGTGTTGEPRP